MQDVRLVTGISGMVAVTAILLVTQIVSSLSTVLVA
jgi:hypothetical protein